MVPLPFKDLGYRLLQVFPENDMPTAGAFHVNGGYLEIVVKVIGSRDLNWDMAEQKTVELIRELRENADDMPSMLR